MKRVNRLKIEETLEKVINKLLNLEGPENEEELAQNGGETIGYFKRDFGIKEWDWPQGVGLYGLMKVMKAKENMKLF